MDDVAALFVDAQGLYPTLPDVDAWDESRDARLYAGPLPVVAHPPCHLWVNLAAVNWRRYTRQRPAWYPSGDDGGCFTAALRSVLTYGGVLEHPAHSHAWPYHGLPNPKYGRHGYGWTPHTYRGLMVWVCEVWQSAYGHRARKRTWLLYAGVSPPGQLDWSRQPGTHQVGWFDRSKPTLGKRAASATPREFAMALVELAKGSSRGA
jgi:hypothetical protein